MISQVDARDVAQAVELVRALHGQLHGMSRQLTRRERHSVTARNGQASAIRLEVAWADPATVAAPDPRDQPH
jgi:hypothetical protein